MPTPHVTRVFVPANVIDGKSEGLADASADACSSLIGAPERYELAGFLVPLCELEARGVPGNVAQLAGMIVGLNTSQNVVLLRRGQVWELMLQSGEGLPETYTFPQKTDSTLTPRPMPRRDLVTRFYAPRHIRRAPAAPARRWSLLGLF